MMEKPNISVVMATYNGEQFLRKQLDSILKQQLLPEEIIISDDHSTDRTTEILEEYGSAISYSANPNKRGVISNFKHAASKANKQHYLAFADQDDLWLPEKLLYSVSAMGQSEDESLPCVVYSDPVVINNEDEVIAESLWSILGFDQYEHKLETIVFGNPAGGCTMLINPALAHYIPTIPDDGYMHDAWLVLSAYTFGKAYVMKEKVLKYRQHDTNVTFSNNYKPKGRLARVFTEITSAVMGQNDLFAEQFLFIRQFYTHFYQDIPADKKRIFESFLKLEKASYLKKKLAFRKAIKA